MITSARLPAVSRNPFNCEALALLIWLTMIFADWPAAKFGLPLMVPPCCVWTMVGELLRIAPFDCTSKRLYVLTETPAPEGRLMLT
jgi:hypothetical protein